MKLEVWADFICPWCGLGAHRLERALADFRDRDAVEVVRHSFQLDPNAPAGQVRTVRAMLTERYGMNEAQFQAATRRVEDLATAEGLAPYRVGDNQVGSTTLAHGFAAFATERGVGGAAWARLYRAYFGEARSIFDAESLVGLAPEVGLDTEETRQALSDGTYLPTVRRGQEEAHRLGITGVPCFVLDRRFAVSGAQSVTVLRNALEKSLTS